MCCCDKPTINGQPGFKWSPNDPPRIIPPNPPLMLEGDVLLLDEPGRCGGLDCHSHHFRVVRRHGSTILLVRHGGGDEEVRLFCLDRLGSILATIKPEDRYWVLHALYSAHKDAARQASEQEGERWRQAAAEGRIKTRKERGTSYVRVRIEAEAEGRTQ